MTDQIDKLKQLNGELCAEINEKDRRIRELENAYSLLQSHFDITRERWMKRGEYIAKQQERIRELESLVLDAERLLTMWDKADWNCTPDEDKMGDYEPEGNLRVLQERIAALGGEVD